MTKGRLNPATKRVTRQVHPATMWVGSANWPTNRLVSSRTKAVGGCHALRGTILYFEADRDRSGDEGVVVVACLSGPGVFDVEVHEACSLRERFVYEKIKWEGRDGVRLEGVTSQFVSLGGGVCGVAVCGGHWTSPVGVGAGVSVRASRDHVARREPGDVGSRPLRRHRYAATVAVIASLSGPGSPRRLYHRMRIVLVLPIAVPG